ncbi:RluA family pseudouridine synthase [Aureliella helgolandensis]|uniref:Pseudouridine synthase n=1 Tax=Aureliella helgolandensis TaxID=2527968 RepID=A0A518GF95_9BACT|nr:RluA family pseudouridine synthase [Aureliella helgolandensis]QDV27275.1 Pseudouridine synthase [Aureliella helgolandensis]
MDQDPSTTELFEHTVLEAENGQRIDAMLAILLDAYSRVFLRKVVQDGGARVNGEVVKPSFRVKEGQQVELDLPPPPVDGPQPEDIALDVLFEDDYLIAIDKPAGMVVHPAKGNWSGTLASALAFRFQQLSDVGGVTRPGIVHRLDRDTTGVILVAKSNAVHLRLSEQFEQRTIQKEYFAIVVGRMELDRDVVRQPIGPHPYQRDKMAIRKDHPQSREAETRYEVMERFEGIASVKVEPKTGRTHQIRVHLDHVGTPVLCDRLYAGHSRISRGEVLRRMARKEPPQAGDEEVLLARQALHARRIAFTHPISGKPLTIESPIPPDMQSVLDVLRSR